MSKSKSETINKTEFLNDYYVKNFGFIDDLTPQNLIESRDILWKGIKNRIIQLMTLYRINIKELAEIIKKENTLKTNVEEIKENISNFLSSSFPSLPSKELYYETLFSLIEKILIAFPEINPFWLIVGIGNIYSKYYYKKLELLEEAKETLKIVEKKAPGSFKNDIGKLFTELEILLIKAKSLTEKFNGEKFSQIINRIRQTDEEIEESKNFNSLIKNMNTLIQNINEKHTNNNE